MLKAGRRVLTFLYLYYFNIIDLYIYLYLTNLRSKIEIRYSAENIVSYINNLTIYMLRRKRDNMKF